MLEYLSSPVSFFLLIISLIADILVSAMLFKGESPPNSTFISSIVMEFIIIISYNSLFFIISMIIGKPGSSIAFCTGGPSVVGLLLTLLESFLKTDKFKISDYWLDNCLSSIQVINYETSAVITSLVISIIVIFASVFIGLKSNSKKESKKRAGTGSNCIIPFHLFLPCHRM